MSVSVFAFVPVSVFVLVYVLPNVVVVPTAKFSLSLEPAIKSRRYGNSLSFSAGSEHELVEDSLPIGGLDADIGTASDPFGSVGPLVHSGKRMMPRRRPHAFKILIPMGWYARYSFVIFPFACRIWFTRTATLLVRFGN